MKKYLIGVGIVAITALLGGRDSIAQATATNAVPTPVAQSVNPATATNNIINDPSGAPLRTNSPSLNTNAPTPLHSTEHK